MVVRNNIIKSLIFLMILLISGMIYSCFSVKYSATGATPPGKTYSVQYIENQARIVEPGLSQDFTEELKDYIQSNSNLVLITNSTGDNDFEVVITTYEPSTPATIVAGDEASQNKFTISVKVKYTCNVDPELDFESSFSRFKLYDVNNSFESVKEDYTKEIMELIFEDIYKRAFVNW